MIQSNCLPIETSIKKPLNFGNRRASRVVNIRGDVRGDCPKGAWRLGTPHPPFALCVSSIQLSLSFILSINNNPELSVKDLPEFCESF